MSQSRTPLMWSLLFACLSAPVVADEPIGAPNPNVPELQVLSRFEGRWEAQLGNSDQKITSSRVWTLDGYFLKHEFSAAGALVGVIYRGYDTKNRNYTMTFHDSQGNVSMLTGYWNDDLKTLTYEALHSSCALKKYESYFPNEKAEHWTIVFETDNRAELSGVAKRVD